MRRVRRFMWADVALLCTLFQTTALAAVREGIPLQWVTCGADHPGFECAVAQVPLDHARSRGPVIDLALARLPARDPQHRIGSLFLNPGGPGASGVDFAFAAGELLQSVLQGRFDIVGFDPRGVARSTPLRCFTTAAAEADFFAGTPAFPFLPEQEEPFFRLEQAFAQQCLEANESIARHMSTADVARDLDLLRAAVGDAQLSYLGLSYGTFLGSTYANLFPGRVRAMVLDGVVDPRVWSNGWFAMEAGPAGATELAEFFRLCDEAGSACALSGAGGARSRFERLVEHVKRAPMAMPRGAPLTYDQVVGLAFQSLYVPERWGGPSGYATLLGALADAALGDHRAADTAVQTWAALDGALAAARTESPAYDNALDARYGTMCSDIDFPATPWAFSAMGEQLQRASLFGPGWWWMAAPCASWPSSRTRHMGPWTATSASPVLLVGNRFDGVTSYEGSLALHRLMPGSQVLTYMGWGHTATTRSPCVLGHVATYLLSQVMPAPETVCPASGNPFLPSPTARASAAALPLIDVPAWGRALRR